MSALGLLGTHQLPRREAAILYRALAPKPRRRACRHKVTSVCLQRCLARSALSSSDGYLPYGIARRLSTNPTHVGEENLVLLAALLAGLEDGVPKRGAVQRPNQATCYRLRSNSEPGEECCHVGFIIRSHIHQSDDIFFLPFPTARRSARTCRTHRLGSHETETAPNGPTEADVPVQSANRVP